MTRNAFVFSLIILVTLVSCSPQQQQSQQGNASPTPESAETATTFQFPTYAYVTRTEAPQVATAAAVTAIAATERASGGSLDPVAVERGKGRYEALECATCHGANGEGIEGKGSSLIGTTLSEEDFISFLRSGGTIGISHQYATNRLSTSGGENLYQYILSLSVG
jgi:mono/diheme cytochrome c family protein